MLAVLSNGDATVIVALLAFITAGGVGAGSVVAHRNRKDIKQINKAVNHQADGEPTLVQRVIRLEENQSIHTAWTAAAFETIAHQLGVELPERPESIVAYNELPHRKDQQ